MRSIFSFLNCRLQLLPGMADQMVYGYQIRTDHFHDNAAEKSYHVEPGYVG